MIANDDEMCVYEFFKDFSIVFFVDVIVSICARPPNQDRFGKINIEKTLKTIMYLKISKNQQSYNMECIKICLIYQQNNITK